MFSKRKKNKTLSIEITHDPTRLGPNGEPLLYGTPECPAVIQGRVIFETDHNCKGGDIEVDYTVQARVGWTDKTPLTQFSYDCQSNYEHRKITVALKHPKPGTIQAGRYTGTLNFPIDPLKMPSSTILEKGRVMYKIVARLRRKFSNGDLVAEQDVWVFNSSLQRPSATDAAQEKMVYSPETSMPLSLVPTLDEPFILHPKISTSCEIPKAVFCAGETFPLAIKLVAVPVDPSHQPSSVSQPAKPGLLLPNWIKSRIGGTNGSENVALAMALPTVVVRLQQTVVYKDHAGTAMFHEHSNHAARFQLQGRIGAASAALLVVLPSLGDVLVLDSSRAENGAQRTKTGTANNCKIQATAYGFKPSAECKALTIRHELQVYLEYSIRGSSHPKLSRYSVPISITAPRGTELVSFRFNDPNWSTLMTFRSGEGAIGHLMPVYTDRGFAAELYDVLYPFL